MQRTIRLVLHPMPEQEPALRETLVQFTQSFNAVCRYGWEHGEKNGVVLHHATYYDQKAALPRLVSDLRVQARVKATEAVKSALTLQRQGRRVSCPKAAACPVRYNLHTYKLDWESRTVRLSTTQGRKTLRFDLPAYAAKYAGCPTDTADLLCRKGRWWLCVVVTVEALDVAPTDAAMGVDLGVVRPAVTSTAQFLGERRWRELEARTFRLRRKLQAKGSKSAKRRLKRLSGKTLRRRRDHDHVLSKRIVQAAPAGGTIVLENLTNIRSRAKIKKGTSTSRRIHGWSFDQLQGFIAYKAEERGLTVASVDPRHTSQMCSACGHQARNNRRSQGDFWCRQCGYRLNADLNGAKNIAAKYLANRGTPPAGGLPVMQPIVSEVSHQGSLPDASRLL